ncbi:hypothetical protein C900_04417 [Fulvivirga imtechensis AK7]|uniref:Leucine-binding protein domain-containing protein n=1 Tax=Fulvivirga imtechensis AK7 TaxID=1237149 RepID=L8JRQ4_9BACT|nr:ABC transporter substrate-binding protein [Fulvivirga imtechensis]ELR70047.1 hypothetical protein C900_04417 [Fulvivirga imtechensis AK7]
MKYIKSFVVFWLFIGLTTAFAQVSNQQQYLNAKELFNNGKYSLAMEAFKSLTQANENNPFAPYASFYYAVAAYREGYPPVAKNMFLQIRDRFPSWSRMNEVNFWLGKIYFENEEYNQGLNVLKSIRDKAFQDDIRNLKYHTFSGIEKVERLKELYKNNADDRVIAEVLAKNIASQTLINQDQELLDELIRKFDLDKAGLSVVKVEKSVFKDKYRVAVLFPFLMNRLEPNDRKKVNQLVLDTYHGIQLAIDSLKAQDINIELYAYDTRGDSTVTAKILEKDELKSMDLIIGPLFPDARAVVQQFSFRHKINMINPLSSDSDIVGNNPYSFLLNPSNETVGRKTADYIEKKARNKNCIIFYGETRNDSVLAIAYKQRIESYGFKVAIMKEIKKRNSRQILDLLLISDEKIKEATSEEGRSNLTIAQDSIGHIFVASDNDLISAKVMSAVETRGDSIMVVGSVNWLDLPAINYEAYQRLGVVLYAPLYIPKETEAYEAFRSKYVKKHKVPPSRTAEIGYDLMKFLGHSLHKYGKYFQLGWNKEYLMDGYLTIGYCYHQSQDNEVVPMLTFGDEGLKVVYEIEQEDEDRKK